MLNLVQKQQFIGTHEAAEMIGVNRSTITRWVNSGRIKPALTVPGYRGNFLFTADSIQALKEGK